MLIHQFLLAVTALFAMVNPIANLPVFIALTAGEPKKARIAIARNGVITAFIIVAAFCLAGNLLFQMFGITMPALRITGGILIFSIGFKMLQGAHSAVQHPSKSDQANAVQQTLDVAISPLAMPILAGPGTIATAMNLSSGHDRGFESVLITIAAMAAMSVITNFLFRYGPAIVRVMGQNLMNVTTRLMGLILAVIGMQMLIDGVHGAIKLFT